ncbi:hypothetical protein VP01_6006g1 [Puccinia sorghi]|uniref:Uncharacterized protein n=1 Tax=Puccinia sorghi TaxID=27349 RepID=A0A0L6UI81_9BASI|nr:hypothetical protein VP01_6006g1 [Puccinia sorghi]
MECSVQDDTPEFYSKEEIAHLHLILDNKPLTQLPKIFEKFHQIFGNSCSYRVSGTRSQGKNQRNARNTQINLCPIQPNTYNPLTRLLKLNHKIIKINWPLEIIRGNSNPEEKEDWDQGKLDMELDSKNEDTEEPR